MQRIRLISASGFGVSNTHLIAIDQSTTSTRAIVFDAALKPVASASEELTEIYPAPGEVEHDPEEIWAAVGKAVRAAIAKARSAAFIAGLSDYTWNEI